MSSKITMILLVPWLAGAAAFLGGLVALIEGSRETHGKRELIHGVVAFGGGILVAAVAFALAPEGIAVLSVTELAATFCAGGVLFCFIDAYLSKKKGSVAQFMAMLLDFVPEAISLGAVFARERQLGLLLALYIGLQNLPEGFNAFRELVHLGRSSTAALGSLLAASLLGPVAAFTGYAFLREHETWIAAIMSFAGGGILYLIFQDIAPQAKMRRHWMPPLGAVLGFLVGLLGKKIIG